MGLLSNKIDIEQLNPGDHIYSWRQSYIYAHHGIYVGLGMVIHFTSGAGQEIGRTTILDHLSFSSSSFHATEIPCPTCNHKTSSDGVIASCLSCFLSGNHLCRFEYGVSIPYFLGKVQGGTCTLAPSDSEADVLHHAYLLLENGFGRYDTVNNNCEDFAIYCKTGLQVDMSSRTRVGLSGQALSFFSVTGSIISALRFISTKCAGMPIGCAMYCFGRYVTDIGVRSDVSKVPVEKLIAEMKMK
ncbi:hypothetical protein Lal_00038572 [Lupinus albus]|uniref:Putative LRAT-like domain-containing protein n=1 Tax=Lupinus albus TaxID=3870 RepID=A0A6A4NKH2_LUPAL|nr:putative LRAT-like domain-containing protein [Lupinus albus]KAF1881928.1 hypothetical protein Lal_00038572 [Lupinus albus]